MANNLVVCGGTFDHFHKGHEEFLSYALSIGEKIIIGLTSDKYVRNLKLLTSLKLRGASKIQNSKLIEGYGIRKNRLEEFLSRKKVQDKTTVLKIDDLFGPTLSKNLLIDAIIISEESKKGADIINQKRKDLGLAPLKILIFPSVKAEDGKFISSTRIRDGEINREGRLYIKPLWLKKNLILPEDLRGELKKPFGKIVEKVEQNDNASYIIAVGDETSRKFNSNSINQNISVIDFKVARREIFSSFSDLGFPKDEIVITANNPAGHLTHDLFSKVLKIIKSDFDKRIILKITGEEDLVVLPLILAVPLNTVIYYGQPNMGLVEILISEDIKEKAYNLVSKFRPIETHTRGY